MTALIPITGALTPASGASQTGADRKQAAIESMAADFEAIFVRQMLTTMRNSSLGEGLFDGQGLEQFRDMQDAKIAESMAQKGVFGIAQLLTRHLANEDV